MFSLLLPSVTMKADCPKWWPVRDPSFQSEAVKAARQTFHYQISNRIKIKYISEFSHVNCGIM